MKIRYETRFINSNDVINGYTDNLLFSLRSVRNATPDGCNEFVIEYLSDEIHFVEVDFSINQNQPSVKTSLRFNLGNFHNAFEEHFDIENPETYTFWFFA